MLTLAFDLWTFTYRLLYTHTHHCSFAIIYRALLSPKTHTHTRTHTHKPQAHISLPLTHSHTYTSLSLWAIVQGCVTWHGIQQECWLESCVNKRDSNWTLWSEGAFPLAVMSTIKRKGWGWVLFQQNMNNTDVNLHIRKIKIHHNISAYLCT